MKAIEILAFGGPMDMTLVFFVILLLFGAKKLPEFAKGMGQAIREFNKAKDEIEKELTKPAIDITVQPAPNKQEYLPAVPPPAAPPTVAEVKSNPNPGEPYFPAVPPPAAPAPKEEPAPQVSERPLL